MKKLDKLENLMNELGLKYKTTEVTEKTSAEIKKIVSEEISRVKRYLKEVDDSQVPMAYASLEKSKEYSEMIYQKMKESDVQNVDGWVFAKLTLAEDYLKSVFVYLDGRDGLDDTINTPDDVEN